MNNLDNNRTIGMRRSMVEELEIYAINNKLNVPYEIIDTFRTVPRHIFAPIGFESIAYEMKPMLIGENQTMSNPHTVFIQTYLLEPNSNDIVLEIGTGSGYQSSILSQLVREVHTIERFKSLNESAEKTITKLGIDNVSFYYGDGFLGKEELAPFDKIIVTCGAPEIPKTLTQQLKVGGRMVIPVNNDQGTQTMLLVIKTDEDDYHVESFGEFQFVPMLKGTKFTSL